MSTRDGSLYWVQRVVRHPTADAALLVLGEYVEDAEPFVTVQEAQWLGEPFHAFGYPEDSLGTPVRMAKARLFAGHFQRFFWYESPHTRYRYAAAELSIPAPGGLSGGPVFPQDRADVVMALVAENYESTTLLDAVEEINRAGELHTIRYQSKVSYGIAVLLDPLRDWLDEHVPISHG